MSAILSNFNTKSFCVSCLSQGRKLYTLSTSKMYEKLFSELSLTWKDEICWECYYTVKKVVAFKIKADKAQAWLQSTIVPQNKFPSLSTLTSSKGISLNIIDLNPATNTHHEPPEIATVSIKEEVLDNDLSQASLNMESGVNFNESEASFNMDSGESSTVFLINKNSGEVRVKEEFLEVEETVVNNIAVERKRKSTESTSYNQLGSIYTTTLKQMLESPERKRKTIISNETAPPEPPSKLQSESSDKDKGIQKQQTPPTLRCADDAYKEVAMTEEQMKEWQETKKTSKFFTQSIPLERCDICIQAFYFAVDAKAHAVKHNESYGNLECDICHVRTPDKKVLDFHRLQHYRLFKCENCDFEWDSVNTMRQHCADLHRTKQTKWDCEECGREFHFLKRLRNHERVHRIVQCPDCHKLLVKQYLSIHTETFLKRLRNHERVHRIVQCPDCHKLLVKQYLSIHTETAHGVDEPSECGECGKLCRNKAILKTHIDTHKTKKKKDARTLDDFRPEFFCKECVLQFHSPSSYKKHLLSLKHTPRDQYEFECEQCKKKFPDEKTVRNHFDVTHLGKKPYKCKQCDESFNYRSNLNRHTSHAHDKRELLRSHVCDYCGKTFTKKAQLTDHINSHTGARPHVCKLCGADFGHKSALYLHGRYKHKIPKKKTVGKDGKSKKENI